MAEQKKVTTRNIAQNKKAWHDYFVDEKLEAGIELFGTEVKSLRAGTVNLKDSYCEVDGGEIYGALRERGILVRHFTAPRIAAYNRITVGSRAEMEALVSALKEILEERS